MTVGPNNFVHFTTGIGTASRVGLARSLYGIFWFFVFLAFVSHRHRSPTRKSA